ncbi:hypothetical protein FPV67DRAFT_1426546 [Lyophyllum atratum]|nr:hypothetical protein FPV67DRAFT_1426546 [Lyophyllum atratum]
MTTTGNNPPIWAEEYKFDGTNFVGFKGRILVTTRLRGALGYLEGKITKPTALPSSALPPEPTEWESNSPSLDEWNKRDAWVLALITYNCKNPMGYGIKMDGTGADAWKSHFRQPLEIPS